MPEEPAAITIPFDEIPTRHIVGDPVPIRMDRVVTPRFSKDVDELQTWSMDIREVLAQNAIADMLQEEDAKYLRNLAAWARTSRRKELKDYYWDHKRPKRRRNMLPMPKPPPVYVQGTS
jgi:hypothetical protein